MQHQLCNIVQVIKWVFRGVSNLGGMGILSTDKGTLNSSVHLKYSKSPNLEVSGLHWKATIQNICSTNKISLQLTSTVK